MGRPKAVSSSICIAMTILLAGLLATCGHQPQSSSQVQPRTEDAITTQLAISRVTVGVADLDTALALWVGTFGLELLARRPGPDPELGRLWSLAAERIVDQALVGGPGLEIGRLHLVQFADPDPPVRAGAAATDWCPKNLDLLCHDLPQRYQELKAAGHVFRSEWVEYPAKGLTVREVQMAGHDATNIVLLEQVGVDIAVNSAGYTGLTAFVATVPDPGAETRFFSDVVGLDVAAEMLLRGEEIEAMIGLSPGAGLDVRLLGPSEPFGRLEIVHYQQIDSANLHPRARPPALGTLHVGFHVPALDDVRRRARAAGIEVTEHGNVDAIYGQVEVCSLVSPAGLRVEISA